MVCMAKYWVKGGGWNINWEDEGWMGDLVVRGGYIIYNIVYQLLVP